MERSCDDVEHDKGITGAPGFLFLAFDAPPPIQETAF